MEFEPVIGFEVHAQLLTASKIFCACASGSGGDPNTRVCPVCLGMPGVLPVLNERAVDLGIRVALALDARVARRTGFARKSYFYPDLPKGYQITQHAEPLAVDGRLHVDVDGRSKRIGICQIHIEEDAGKTTYKISGGWSVSLVDMNRCGVPLVEVVTRPDIRSLREADAFLTKLRQVLTYLGVTEGSMHEGNLRFDANVSVRRKGDETLGVRTEIKNLNSFKAARKALGYEVERQTRMIEGGGRVVHETLFWDEAAERAAPMRSKEVASDYRYFPEPDLPDVEIDEARVDRIRAAMPELPDDTRDRLRSWYGIPDYDAEVLTAELWTALFYEATIRELLRMLHPELGIATADAGALTAPVGQRPRFSDFPPPAGVDDLSAAAKTVSNWVMVIVGGYLNARGIDLPTFGLSRMTPARLASVILPRFRGEINGPAARRLFEAAAESNEPIDALIERLHLAQISDEAAVAEAVATVLDAHPEEVRRFRSGEEKLLGFFMGEVMRETGGRANPGLAREILRRRLES